MELPSDASTVDSPSASNLTRELESIEIWPHLAEIQLYYKSSFECFWSRISYFKAERWSGYQSQSIYCEHSMRSAPFTHPCWVELHLPVTPPAELIWIRTNETGRHDFSRYRYQVHQVIFRPNCNLGSAARCQRGRRVVQWSSPAQPWICSCTPWISSPRLAMHRTNVINYVWHGLLKGRKPLLCRSAVEAEAESSLEANCPETHKAGATVRPPACLSSLILWHLLLLLRRIIRPNRNGFPQKRMTWLVIWV